MNLNNEIGGIILAGGESRRMGEDKGLMEYQGKMMIQHVIDTLMPLTNEILIVSNKENYPLPGVRVVEDEIKGNGPLIGIISGLEQSNCEWNWVLSCDSPHVSERLLMKLKKGIQDNIDVIWSKEAKRVHPLIGMYRKRAITGLRRQWADQKLKLTRLQEYVAIKEIDFQDWNNEEFKNINNRSDL